MRTYEGLYIFEDSLRDADLDAALERVQADITRMGGIISSTLPMGRKTFARPIRKRETGQYFRILFDLAPDQVAPLRARYRINETIVRVQIVSADAATGAGATEAEAPAAV